MTTQIASTAMTDKPSAWQKLLAWLTAFERALDYDPQEYADARIGQLADEVENLNARLDGFERRNQRAA